MKAKKTFDKSPISKLTSCGIVFICLFFVSGCCLQKWNEAAVDITAMLIFPSGTDEKIEAHRLMNVYEVRGLLINESILHETAWGAAYVPHLELNVEEIIRIEPINKGLTSHVSTQNEYLKITCFQVSEDFHGIYQMGEATAAALDKKVSIQGAVYRCGDNWYICEKDETEIYCDIDGKAADDSTHIQLKNLKLNGTSGYLTKKNKSAGKPMEVIKVSNSLNMEFVYIQPGKFMMGSPSNERGRNNDEKQHQVTLTRGFFIQTTEVSQGQWKAVMGRNPSYFKSCGDKCPVEQISWNDAQQFIRKLNQREGTDTYRLPTEAEWEYAARAGSTTAFANGEIKENGFGFDLNLDAMGWYCANSNKKTHPVAQKQSNVWGLYDIHGNVWEWCQDWHGDYPSGSVSDPTGPANGSHRVLRGGSWDESVDGCRSAYRALGKPGHRDDITGFRLLRDP